MKFFSVIALTLCFANPSKAWDLKPVQKGFIKSWNASPIHRNGTTEAKVFKKYIQIGGNVVSVGSLTYFKTINPKEKLPKDIASQIKRAFDAKFWSQVRKGNSLFMRGYWEGGNRVLYYHIYEDKKQTVITSSTMRPGYMDSTLPESMILQRALIEKAKNPGKKKSGFIQFILNSIPTATAGPLDGLFGGNNGGSGGLDGLTSSTDDISELSTSIDEFTASFEDLSVQLDRVNTNFEGANANWSETNNQIEGANNNWSETNNQIDGANNNWADTNRQLEGFNDNLAGFRDEAGKTREMVDKNWSETNRQFSRANDLAAKMADPKHMFTLAAATSAGAVFGATLANLAIDGVVAGAKWVYDLITDASGKKERWEKFRKARKGWEKTLDNARKLEKLLDQFLTSQELMNKIRGSLSEKDQAKLSREGLVRHLSLNIRRGKKKKKTLESEFEQTVSPACEEHLANKLDNLDAVLTTAEGLKTYLDNERFKVYNDKLFCSQLHNIMNKLGEAEASLQTYRLNILNARTEWAEKNEERNEEIADTIKRLNDVDNHKDFHDQRVENAEDMYKSLKKAVKVRRKSWILECKTSHPDWRKHFWDDDDKERHRWAIEETCEKSYDSQYSARDERNLQRAKAAEKKKIELAARDLKRSKIRPIELNEQAEDARLISYYKWFGDLEEQQYCYTHPEDKKCKDQSQVKFMGPFYVKDRARVKLKEVCGMDSYNY